MNSRWQNIGFTLIEILVVVSIISIMVVVAYGSLGDSRESAADQALMAEFKQIQTALELYKAQNDGNLYPLPNTTGACGIGSAIAPKSSDVACATDYIVGLVPAFTSELPSSEMSANPACDITYETDLTRSWYKLTAVNCLAGGVTITVDDELARCPSSCSTCASDLVNTTYLNSDAFTKSFAVYGASGATSGQCR